METQAGSRYFLTCLDDKTRKIHVSFLRHKSEALDKLKDYLALVQNQLGTTAKIIKSDGGGEFTSTAFKEFCTTRGIQHIIVPPGAHAQNGRVERVHLTLANGMRTLLVDSGSPSTFWAEAINFMVHVKNSVASRGHQGRPTATLVRLDAVHPPSPTLWQHSFLPPAY